MDKFKELGIEESLEISGGLTWWGLIGIFAVAHLVETVQNPTDSINAISNGYNDGKNEAAEMFN